MLKPSKRHFLIYDAQTFEKSGFIKVAGKVQQLAQKPRLWRVSVSPVTTDGTQIDKTRIVFNTDKPCRLSELAPVINEHIFSLDGFLDHCVSVIVCARIMTEGGK